MTSMTTLFARGLQACAKQRRTSVQIDGWTGAAAEEEWYGPWLCRRKGNGRRGVRAWATVEGARYHIDAPHTALTGGAASLRVFNSDTTTPPMMRPRVTLSDTHAGNLPTMLTRKIFEPMKTSTSASAYFR